VLAKKTGDNFPGAPFLAQKKLFTRHKKPFIGPLFRLRFFERFFFIVYTTRYIKDILFEKIFVNRGLFPPKPKPL